MLASMTPVACLAASLALSSPALAAQPIEAVTWDSVDALIEREVQKGFSGSLLLVHDGKIVLHEGYGKANRDLGIANTGETVFALGSTPIDFTQVAILQLYAKGLVDLQDPITKYFDKMPRDKHAITLDHLMSGGSGLPDFLEKPGEDPDHTFITRDEFVQRIRESKLLFQPGQGDEHSHAAWCLLAAVVEVASGQTYQEYVRENILKPAKMTRTGFNGDQFPNETVAVGYGFKSWGEVNTPPKWGKTSWLVMGSGGMVGTVGDLRRYHEAVDSGKIIPEKVFHLYPADGLFVNGDMYGFENMFNYGGDDLFYLNCNSSNLVEGYNLEPFGLALHQLCTNQPIARFSIGIAFDNADDTLLAARVLPGSPAEDAGLRAGDELIAADGVAFDLEDPLEAIRDAIEVGKVTRIEVLRAGKPLTITLTPRRREP